MLILSLYFASRNEQYHVSWHSFSHSHKSKKWERNNFKPRVLFLHLQMGPNKATSSVQDLRAQPVRLRILLRDAIVMFGISPIGLLFRVLFENQVYFFFKSAQVKIVITFLPHADWKTKKYADKPETHVMVLACPGWIEAPWTRQAFLGENDDDTSKVCIRVDIMFGRRNTAGYEFTMQFRLWILMVKQ